jgi:WD40 repeat protein
MAWSADGERLAVGGALDLRMSVLDVQTGRQLPAPGEQLAGVRGLAYSPDGRYLAVIRAATGRKADPAAQRYTVSLWDARTSARVAEIVEPDSAGIENIQAHALSFSFDGRYLAVAYLKQTAVYALTGDGGIQRVLLLPAASRCAFRPDAEVVACLSMGLGVRTLALYRVPDGEITARFDLRGTNLGWSSGGHLLATTDGPLVNIHDMTDRQVMRTLAVVDPDARFQSVSFSADGRWFAAASDRRVDLWETTTWAHATTLGHQRNFVSVATFAPRESLLGIVGYAPATIWNVRPR